ncbi:YdcF family protein [uncultured Cedecea sp.]|uniref:YdcF family protein n=1 Tax=uncultured Cedecea sp. TaxID=988762 RepID=UPI002633A9AE|nr:YdcF family protein [uncultured Cedecea sp.]
MMLSDAIIRDLNILADWLSVDDFSEQESTDHDLLILAGHAIIPTILGALYLASEADIPVLLSGGIGHSTPLLKKAMQDSLLINFKDINEESEAELLSLIASRLFHIPEEKILIEDRSANCGQNADFSRDLLARRSFNVKSVLLVQDPLMQRRTYETFSCSWKQKNRDCQFTNWPVFKPKLLRTRAGVKITGAQVPGLWGIERYISMILGEIKRLYDDESGYGPEGAGFIDHVDIPANVAAAWRRLLANPELVRIIR